MELYNSLIKDTEAFLAGGSPKRWDYAERDCWTDLGSSELVMQRDAAYELGGEGLRELRPLQLKPGVRGQG